MSRKSETSIKAAARLVAEADALVIAAGAGMGVDSGLPDFRGSDGFWNSYPALRGARLSFIDVANPELFKRNPALAWGFYGHRLQLYRSTMPHDGFQILKKLGGLKRDGLFVFTSNVDGQFQKAGFDGNRIAECHGSIHHLQCTAPCSDDIWAADDLQVNLDASTCSWTGPLPRCPRCGALARPNILMFGDGNWLEHRTQAQMIRMRTWLSEAHAPVVIEVGAGSSVPTVRNFSESLVRSFGARLIRINPDESDVPPGRGVGVPQRALRSLALLDAEIYRA